MLFQEKEEEDCEDDRVKELLVRDTETGKLVGAAGRPSGLSRGGGGGTAVTKAFRNRSQHLIPNLTNPAFVMKAFWGLGPGGMQRARGFPARTIRRLPFWFL